MIEQMHWHVLALAMVRRAERPWAVVWCEACECGVCVCVCVRERERERERREREEREKRRDEERLANACVQRLVHSRDNNTERRDSRRARGDEETKHRAPPSSCVATTTATCPDDDDDGVSGVKTAKTHQNTQTSLKPLSRRRRLTNLRVRVRARLLEEE